MLGLSLLLLDCALLMAHTAPALSVQKGVPFILISGTLSVLYWWVSRHLLQPLRHIRQTLLNAQDITEIAPSRSLAHLARDIHRLSDAARRHYRHQQHHTHEMAQLRSSMHAIHEQYALLTRVAEEETRQHYQAVMSYAHYLEERVIAKHADASLRYDFDDTCESSFALALITNALSLLHTNAAHTPTELSTAQMLQHTLVKLAAALDRRNMRLDSTGVDLTTIAYADANFVQLAVWIMLLGTVRYAQDESTLKLRTLTSRDGTSAILSIVISELSPGALSVEERAVYLERRLRHPSSHLFAEAITHHANMRLVNLLLAHTGSHAEVTPLTPTCCEIMMTLPAQV